MLTPRNAGNAVHFASEEARSGALSDQPNRWGGLTHQEWQTLGVIVGLVTTAGSAVAWTVEKMGTLPTLIVGGAALGTAAFLIAQRRLAAKPREHASGAPRREREREDVARQPAQGTRRPYEELRAIVEQEGGQMRFEREGQAQGGAWIVTFRGKVTVFNSNGSGFPPMDKLYIPRIPEPQSYRDYSNQLVEGARDKWIRMLLQDAPP